MKQKLASDGVKIENLGLIDTPEKAFAAGHAFRQADVDLIFLHVTTYALSSTVLPVVQRARVPVVILNLSIDAARVADVMWHNRLGLMGHYSGGMLDIYSDLTQQCATFGGHIEIIGVEELATLRRAVTPAEIASRVEYFRQVFATVRRQNWSEQRRGRLALDRLVAKHAPGTMAPATSPPWNVAWLRSGPRILRILWHDRAADLRRHLRHHARPRARPRPARRP